MKRRFPFSFLIAACSVFAAEPIPKETWSEIVNGVRGRLAIDYGFDFSGSKTAVVYLELQNVSDTMGHKDIWFDPERSVFKWQLLDEKGAPEPQRSMVGNRLVEVPFWITLPWDSTLRLRVSVSGYAINQPGGVTLQLPSAFWQLSRIKGGAYYLSAAFRDASDPGDSRKAWTGTLTLPPFLLKQK